MLLVLRQVGKKICIKTCLQNLHQINRRLFLLKDPFFIMSTPVVFTGRLSRSLCQYISLLVKKVGRKMKHIFADQSQIINSIGRSYCAYRHNSYMVSLRCACDLINCMLIIWMGGLISLLYLDKSCKTA